MVDSKIIILGKFRKKISSLPWLNHHPTVKGAKAATVIVTCPFTTLDLDTCIPQTATMLPNASTRHGVLNSGRNLPLELTHMTLSSFKMICGRVLSQGVRWLSNTCSVHTEHIGMRCCSQQARNPDSW